jgi:TRAP-type C4-dicarboxylate transport system substrate-binding protein
MPSKEDEIMYINRSAIRVVCAAVIACLGGIAAEPAGAEEVRFSAPTPSQHIFTRSAERFKEAIVEQAEEVEVTVFAGNALGDVPTVLSLLQSGAVQFAIVPAGDLARVDEAFYAWFLPYQFESLADAGAAANLPAARQMLADLAAQGYIGLAYIFPGQRHLLSTFPANNLADLEDKRVRAFPNDIFRAWWTAIGAAPTALPLPEIMPSLITGVVDAVDVDIDIVSGLQMHKQAPYLAMTNHMAFPGALLVSTRYWNELDAETQDKIRQTLHDVQAWAIEEQTAQEQAQLEKLKADGLTVTKVDSGAFRAVADEVWAEFASRDPLIQEFVEQAGRR